MAEQCGNRFEETIPFALYGFETQLQYTANCIPVLLELSLLELSKGNGK
jgi:hypothetical protein